MSEKRFSVKDCSNAETNIVSLLLTPLSDIWNSFLPENEGTYFEGESRNDKIWNGTFHDKNGNIEYKIVNGKKQ